jgi:hypothetical protein
MRLFKHVVTRRQFLFLPIAAGLLTGTTVFAVDVPSPISFSAGTAISSSAVNQNFAQLYQALGNLVVPTVQVFSTPGANPVTVPIPTGATGVMIEVIGGGGGSAGGIPSATYGYGGNGGNGGYGKGYYAITSSNTLTVTIGHGGTGGMAGDCTGSSHPYTITATAGGAGQDSVVRLDSNTLITAKAGMGGAPPTASTSCAMLMSGSHGTSGSASAPLSLALSPGSTAGGGHTHNQAVAPAAGNAGNPGYAIFTFY